MLPLTSLVITRTTTALLHTKPRLEESNRAHALPTSTIIESGTHSLTYSINVGSWGIKNWRDSTSIHYIHHYCRNILTTTTTVAIIPMHNIQPTLPDTNYEEISKKHRLFRLLFHLIIHNNVKAAVVGGLVRSRGKGWLPRPDPPLGRTPSARPITIVPIDRLFLRLLMMY